MLGGNLGSLLYGDVSVIENAAYSVHRVCLVTSISHYGFADRGLVLVISVRGHCLLLTSR